MSPLDMKKATCYKYAARYKTKHQATADQKRLKDLLMLEHKKAIIELMTERQK